MSYLDRIRPLRFISPSGKEFELEFEEVSRVEGKKAPVTEFPGQDQGAIQDLGEVTQVFPISCFISGPDHDLEAERFIAALAETGPGLLLHPVWGDFPVLPSSRRISQGMVQGMGRTNFQIEFIRAEENAFTYPKVEAAPALEISGGVELTAADIGESLRDVTLENAAQENTLKIQVENILKAVQTSFAVVTAISDTLQEAVSQAIDDIFLNIDGLLKDPQKLMESLLRLYRLPAQEGININLKVTGYKLLWDNLSTGFVETTKQYTDVFFRINSAQASALQLAAAESTVSGGIETRAEAIRISEQLLSLDNSINEGIEQIEQISRQLSEPSIRLQSQQTLELAISNVIDRSLSLPLEQTYSIEYEISPLVFLFENYRDIDRLEDFISYNQLSGDEILLLPKGREVRFYE
jgi:prophage DNA circulation protein